MCGSRVGGVMAGRCGSRFVNMYDQCMKVRIGVGKGVESEPIHGAVDVQISKSQTDAWKIKKESLNPP